MTGCVISSSAVTVTTDCATAASTTTGSDDSMTDHVASFALSKCNDSDVSDARNICGIDVASILIVGVGRRGSCKKMTTSNIFRAVND